MKLRPDADPKTATGHSKGKTHEICDLLKETMVYKTSV